MADRVQIEIEKMIPELQHLVQQRLFSTKEVREIVKQRTQHEYNIIRRTPYLSDFFRYIQYEVKIELTRRRRIKSVSTKSRLLRKSGVSDYSILGRTFRIFNAALMKFPNNISLWFQLIDWALSLKSFGQLSRIFPRALRFHPLSTQLWHRAAQYEYEVVGNIENARVYFQRGLRLNGKSLDLWFGFFQMELSYIGRIAKRHVISNIIPSVERQEQYDRFMKDLQRHEQQQQEERTGADDLEKSQNREKELLQNASLLSWTPDNAKTLEGGDKLLIAGRIAQTIYDAACKQFKTTDGIVATAVGMSDYYSHRHARGLSVKQKLGFLSMINSWKYGREERGVERARMIDRDAKDAHIQLRKELSLVNINERCLALAGVDITALYQHIMLDIFDTIHTNVGTIPDLFTADVVMDPVLIAKALNTSRKKSKGGDSDSDSSSSDDDSSDSDDDQDGTKKGSMSDDENSGSDNDSSDSDKDEDEDDEEGPDQATLLRAQIQQQIDLRNILDRPLVDRDDIGAFWDCFARLSLYCEELQFDLPLTVLEKIQATAPPHRQFSFEIDFPTFPAILPQLEQRALTRYLFGIKVYASFPALADFIPIVLGKLTRFLYRRVKHYFAAVANSVTKTLIPVGSEQHQHLYSIGHAMVSFMESMLAWAGYQHTQYNHLKFTNTALKLPQTTSIPWVSSEMLEYWLKLKMLVIDKLPIYPTHAKTTMYTTNILPKFTPINSDAGIGIKAGGTDTHTQTTSATKSSKATLHQAPPTPKMLQHQTLFQVFSMAIHFIRSRVAQHNETMAKELLQQHTAASSSSFKNTRKSSHSTQKTTHYYDNGLEKLVAMVYSAYANFILRPHWTVVDEEEDQHNDSDDDSDSDDDNQPTKQSAKVRLQLSMRNDRRATIDAYTTLFELHATVMSSHFVGTDILSKQDQSSLFQRLGVNSTTNVNTRPLFSFTSLGLFWKSMLELHQQLLATSSPAAAPFHITSPHGNNNSHIGSLSTGRLSWLLPTILSTILNSKFFRSYTTAITAVNINKQQDNPNMADICLFMQLSALHYFQMIKQGYITQGANVFIPTSSNSQKVSKNTILDVLHHSINTFKTHAIQFANKLISNLAMTTILNINSAAASTSSDSTALTASMVSQGVIADPTRTQSTHQKFKLEQQRILAESLKSDATMDDSSSSDSSSESDSDSDSDSDSETDASGPLGATTTSTVASLTTIQAGLECCMSAIYSPHSPYTYTACLQAFINIYKQQEAQFVQFNSLRAQSSGQNDSAASVNSSIISRQQTILIQLQHRVRKLYLHASRDIGARDMWIWVSYAQFLHYLQQQTSITSAQRGTSLQSKTKSIMAVNNDKLANYSLELLNELASVQQNAIKTLNPVLRAKFVTKIDSLLHK